VCLVKSHCLCQFFIWNDFNFKFLLFYLVPSLSTRKISQHRKVSVDSGAGTSVDSGVSYGNINNKESGSLTPKGDADTTTTLISLNANEIEHASKMANLEKNAADIRITENPISENSQDPENNTANC